MSGKALTGRRCLCTACGEYFNSESVFDHHRTGRFERGGVAGSRRCLSVSEMLARGWSLNRAGFWITKQRQEAVTSFVEGARRDEPVEGYQGAPLIGKDLATGMPLSGQPSGADSRSLEEACCGDG